MGFRAASSAGRSPGIFRGRPDRGSAATPRAPRDRALYVEILIRAPMDRVWQLTQDPEQHARWDGRFTAIRPVELDHDGAQRFRYELDLGLHTIRGTGVSLGEKHAANGARTSALLFDTDDWVSPLRRGRGYWRYVPEGDGVRFITGYDYRPGWGPIGAVLDRWITRRFVWWLTAWSFDRLRLWAESGIEPERTRWWRGWFGGVRARARNCVGSPGSRNHGSRNHGAPQPAAQKPIMDDAPATLETLRPWDGTV